MLLIAGVYSILSRDPSEDDNEHIRQLKTDIHRKDHWVKQEPLLCDVATQLTYVQQICMDFLMAPSTKTKMALDAGSGDGDASNISSYSDLSTTYSSRTNMSFTLDPMTRKIARKEEEKMLHFYWSFCVRLIYSIALVVVCYGSTNSVISYYYNIGLSTGFSTNSDFIHVST